MLAHRNRIPYETAKTEKILAMVTIHEKSNRH
jgi:N6-adenosine-specific RNA methylase IME4